MSNIVSNKSQGASSSIFEGKAKSHLISFAITICAMTLFCIMMRITPFGDNTFLYDDNRREFIQYYAHLKRALLGEASIAYSRTKGMGGSMLGLFFYTMSSPLNFVYALFPIEVFPAVLTVLLVLRLGLSAFTADVFLSHVGVKRTIPFSVSFAMSLWVFVSVLVPSWLDAAIMFPLLATAVLEYSRDTRSRKKFLYLVILTAVQFYINYYTACMMIIFFAIWMVLRFILKVISFKDGLNVALGLITGMLIICPVLLPLYQELTLSEKSVGDSFISQLFQDAHITNPILVLAKIYTFTIDGKQVMFGMPHLFCGTVMIPLLILFFMNRKIDKKIKMQGVFLLAILFISFLVSPLDLIWHAGNVPNGYPFRYTFLFVGVMITSAAISFNTILEQYISSENQITAFTNIKASFKTRISNYFKDKNARDFDIPMAFTVSFAITGIAEVIILICAMVMNIEFLTLKSGIIGLMILMAEFIFIELYFCKKSKVFFILLAILCVCDLLVNHMKIVKASYYPCETMSEYQARYIKKKEKIDDIKATDNNFYRIEDVVSNPYDDINDGMVYDYHAISHYSTGDHRNVRMFLKAIGFNYNSLYDEYTSENTATADSILNIKYILTDEGTVQNSDLFPIAVAIPADTYLPSDEIPDDPFLLQKQIADAFTGCGTNIDEYLEEGNELFVPVNIANKDVSFDDENQISTMKIDFTPECDGDIYFYLKDLVNTSQNMILSVDGVDISGYGNASSIKIIDIGNRKKGDKVSLTLTAYGPANEADFGTPLIFTENTEVLSEYSKLSSSHAAVVSETSPTILTIHIPDTADSDDNTVILLSIPYEPGFIAYGAEDQEPLSVSQVFGALTCIEVPSGYTGDIILDYRIPGLNTGLLLLFIGLLLLLIRYFYPKNHKLI